MKPHARFLRHSCDAELRTKLLSLLALFRTAMLPQSSCNRTSAYLNISLCVQPNVCCPNIANVMAWHQCLLYNLQHLMFFENNCLSFDVVCQLLWGYFTMFLFTMLFYLLVSRRTSLNEFELSVINHKLILFKVF